MRLPFGAFLLLLAGVLLASLHDRAEHYREWQRAPEAHFAGGVPVSSADSYYWFRLAREVRDGQTDFDAPDLLRDHPEGGEYRPLPVLSVLMASVSPLFGGDVYRAGLALTVVLASLFVLPLGLYCWRIGDPAAGLLGAFLGAFSPAYFTRASVHRVDTDGGNLFFVWLLAAAIAAVGSGAAPRSDLRRAALAGLCLAAFCRWYEQPGFWAVYLGAFALHVWLAGLGWRRGARLVGIFALFGNPLNAAGAVQAMRTFVTDYLLAGAGGGDHPLGFAGITRDIAELAPLTFERMLAVLSGSPLVTVVGLAGLLLLLLRHWRRAAPLLPMLLLGLLAFTSARRFAMYLAPLVGMGLGAWLTGAAQLAERLPALRARPRLSVALAPAAALIAIVAVAPTTAYRSRPGAGAIRTELLEALLALRERLPDDAVVAASWSHGYLLQDVLGAATLNDGEAPDPAVEYLLRRGLVSDDPELLRGGLGYLEREGRASLRALFADPARFEDALRTLAAAAAPESPGLHLLFTQRSLREAPVYFRSGLWTPGDGDGPYTGFDLLRCRPGGDGVLDCRKPGVRIAVDLERGTIDGVPRLGRFLDVRDGGVVYERAYDPAGDLIAERLGDAVEGSFPVAFVDEIVFRSNLNQLFLLGRYDAGAYEEVFDAFPVARAYRVLPAAQ